jgi:hypothetical protein
VLHRPSEPARLIRTWPRLDEEILLTPFQQPEVLLRQNVFQFQNVHAVGFASTPVYGVRQEPESYCFQVMGELWSSRTEPRDAIGGRSDSLAKNMKTKLVRATTFVAALIIIAWLYYQNRHVSPALESAIYNVLNATDRETLGKALEDADAAAKTSRDTRDLNDAKRYAEATLKVWNATSLGLQMMADESANMLNKSTATMMDARLDELLAVEKTETERAKGFHDKLIMELNPKQRSVIKSQDCIPQANATDEMPKCLSLYLPDVKGCLDQAHTDDEKSVCRSRYLHGR